MRPIRLMEDVSRDYPGVWSHYDRMLAAREELGGWPLWCFCPLAAAYAVVSGRWGEPVPLAHSRDIARVGALAAWRPTQSIYRFHADLLAALLDSDVDGDLPVEHLLRLPEWCVYIEVERDGIHGFFAHLEHDANSGAIELRLLLDREDGPTAVALQLVGTIEESLAAIVRSGALQAQLAGQRLHLPTGAVESLAEDISPLISVLLYLCSDDPELRPTRGAKRAGTFPALKPGREGPRMPPADRPEVWETGFRLGEALRLARESEELSEGASVRGHIRRAHWHSYWIGPRKEPGKPGQKRIIRWLPPIPVNLEAVPERPTVRSVH